VESASNGRIYPQEGMYFVYYVHPDLIACSRLPGKPPNVQQRSDSNIWTELVNTVQINSSLSMKVLLIAGQRTEDMLGPSVGVKHNARRSLCVANGTLDFSYISYDMLTSSRFSVLPAISLDNGILHCDMIEGSFCTATFTEFIRVLTDNMQPYPEPNSVIVMDNCRIHKHPSILELIESRYVIIGYISLTQR
jgi:hypothetical protein